jgi:hypothetical protein
MPGWRQLVLLSVLQPHRTLKMPSSLLEFPLHI